MLHSSSLIMYMYIYNMREIRENHDGKKQNQGGAWRAGATMGSTFVFVCSSHGDVLLCCVDRPSSFVHCPVRMSGCAEDCAVDGYRVLSEITNAALGGIYNIYTLLKFPDLTQAS